MNILPYSQLLDHSLTNLQTFIKNLIDPHYQNFSINNYTDFLEHLDRSTREAVCSMITATLEAMDDAYRHSENRKQYYYVKCKRARTLYSMFGVVTFTRTIYQDKRNGKCFTYIDRKLGLPRYDRYDPTVKAKVVECYANQNSMIKVGEIVGEQMFATFSKQTNRKNFNISRQTVHNIVKKTHFIKPQNDRVKKIVSTLYIMADEKYIPLQKDTKDKVMVRHGVIFDGLSNRAGRTKLNGKTTHTCTHGGFWNEILDILYAKYDLEAIEKIVIMGDGASWIRNGINVIPKSTFVLDQFHGFQAIERITKDETMNYKLRQTIFENDRKTFQEIVQRILDDCVIESRALNIKKNQDYLVKHWNALQKALDSSIPGCSMEAHISHNLAAVFTSRPKSYTEKNLAHYIHYRDMNQNGIDIQNLYLDTIHINRSNHPVELNKETFDFSMFEPKQVSDKSSTSNWTKGFIQRN